MIRLTPRSTLFPYTTLFRSRTTKRSTSTRCCRARRIDRSEPSGVDVFEEGDQAGDVGLLVVVHGHVRSEEHTSELQSQSNLVCRLLLEKKKKNNNQYK